MSVPKVKQLPNKEFSPSINNNFTSGEWDRMETRDMSAIIELLIHRLLQLGGRNISEKFVAKGVSVILNVSGVYSLYDFSAALQLGLGLY